MVMKLSGRCFFTGCTHGARSLSHLTVLNQITLHWLASPKCAWQACKQVAEASGWTWPTCNKPLLLFKQACVVGLNSCLCRRAERQMFLKVSLRSALTTSGSSHSIFMFLNGLSLLCRCFLLSAVCFITHTWCLSVCARSRSPPETVACAHEARAAGLVGGAQDGENETKLRWDSTINRFLSFYLLQL